jgi:acyl-coenzyme A synthetase/AMP-(fatty) acid ligase
VTRSYLAMARLGAAVLTLITCFGSPLLAQRADRATISGVVTDAQGSAVPGATVTVRNEGTGVESVRVTNEAGAYSSPPLVLGTYSVAVDLTGFNKAVTS